MKLQIPGFENIEEVYPIINGWSMDKKYYMRTTDQKKYIVKTSSIEKYTKKRWEYEMMMKVAKHDINGAHIEAFGSNPKEACVYMVYSWCDGFDAAAILPTLDVKTQYDLGFKAGEMLYNLHQIDIEQPIQNWQECYQKHIQKKLSAYQACAIMYPNDAPLLAFIEKQQALLPPRPQVLQHGDYHIGNMILSKDRTLQIIDFDRMSIGDPWEEFNRIVWSVKISPVFASGQIHGYFHNEVPDDFFKLMALYIGVNTISSLPWAIAFSEEEVHVMINQYQDVMHWYDNMHTYKPCWYFDVSHLPF